MSKHVTDVTSRQECCRAQSLHRLEADPHQTPTLPLVLPVYPAVPDLPKDLDPLDEEEVRDEDSLYPSVPLTEPGSDEDDLFVTLKPPKHKKKTAAVMEM